MSVGSYFKEVIHTYRDNATSVRDYRTQMRGKKAFWIWTIYLALLVLIALLMYESVSRGGNSNPAAIQGRLHDFYTQLCMLLAGAICLIAPGLTASSLAVERQRQSLDLVFSAPVHPRYLLVGKILASYRYVWMLLILALPVMAVSVVFGGATWMDVLGTYVILSASGLVFTGIGVAASTEAKVPMRAMAASYGYMLGYLLFTSYLSTVSGVRVMFGGRTYEAPWPTAMSIFGAPWTSPTYTVIQGVHVPNWVIVLGVSTIITQLLITGAASALSDYRSADTKIFRIFGLVAVAIVPYLVAPSLLGFTRMAGGPGSVSATANSITATYIGLFLPISHSFANLFAYSRIEPRKRKFDGRFNVREILSGLPSGGLPYALLMIAIYTASYIWAVSGGGLDYVGIASGLIWILCYTFGWWGISQYLCAHSPKAQTMRGGVFGLMVVAPLLATMFIAFMMSSTYSSTIWKTAVYHPFYPILQHDNLAYAIPHGLVYFAVGVVTMLKAVQVRKFPPILK